MGASRISYSFKMDIKYKNYRGLFRNLLTLFNVFKKSNKWERRIIILDNFITPFNKKFGCRWFGHKWKFNQEDRNYMCWKCYSITNESDYKSNIRNQKLDKLGL